jgi:DNA (cytosine-5)-methyltransferase 1
MKPLRIGTDCSGIEAPIQALINLQIPFIHVFSSEIDPYCIESIKANYSPKIIFSDITNRDINQVPNIDLYVCGFPCQPFSMAGKRRGTNDIRGTVFFECLKVVHHKRPKFFVLENVRGILSIHNGAYFEMIIRLLENEEYNVYWRIMNTKDYGIPQSRQRVYIVGIRKDIRKKFVWPQPVGHYPLSDYIDISDTHEEPIPKRAHRITRLPEKSLFIDMNFLNSSFPNSDQICPCITSSSQIWCVPLRRSANISELFALQGFPDSFKQVVSKTRLKAQIGNSMSVCVLEAIFSSLLISRSSRSASSHAKH